MKTAEVKVVTEYVRAILSRYVVVQTLTLFLTLTVIGILSRFSLLLLYLLYLPDFETLNLHHSLELSPLKNPRNMNIS